MPNEELSQYLFYFEQPAEPQSVTRSGVAPSTPQTGLVIQHLAHIVPQETQGWQWVWIGSAPQATYISPTVTRVVNLAQEQPWHPSPYYNIQFNYQILPPSISRHAVVVGQEQPDQLPAIARPGVIPSVHTFVPPNTRAVFVAQEQPDHPPPRSQSGVPLSLLTFVPPNERQALVTQEQPDQPAIVVRSSTGLIARVPPVTQSALVVQEQPDQPQSRASGGSPPRTAPRAPQGLALVAQEQPGHPLPRADRGSAAYVLPRALRPSRAIVWAEPLAESPAPVVWFHARTIASPPIVGSIRVVASEMPWHPDSFVSGSSLLAQLAPTQVPYTQVFV